MAVVSKMIVSTILKWKTSKSGIMSVVSFYEKCISSKLERLSDPVLKTKIPDSTWYKSLGTKAALSVDSMQMAPIVNVANSALCARFITVDD